MVDFITVKQKGEYKKLIRFLNRAKDAVRLSNLDKYGQAGVEALKSTTPKDTGLTSRSWYYKIDRTDGAVKIAFHNSNIQNGVVVAIILQYGHAAKNGAWIEGIDYINPAIKPIMEQITNEAWKEVTRL